MRRIAVPAIDIGRRATQILQEQKNESTASATRVQSDAVKMH
jgi:hypothetical protein